MRYKCKICGEMIKDKMFFGLLHLCLTDDEQRNCQEWLRAYPSAQGGSLVERTVDAQRIHVSRGRHL